MVTLGWIGPINTWSMAVGRLMCLDDALREKMGVGSKEWRLEPCAMMGYCAADGPHIHAWRIDFPQDVSDCAHRIFEFKELEGQDGHT